MATHPGYSFRSTDKGFRMSSLTKIEEYGVRLHLEEILDGKLFGEHDRATQFLRFVVEKELVGKGKEITGKTIAAECFRKNLAKESAEFVKDVARKVRDKLRRYYDVPGRPPGLLRIRIEEGSYRPEFDGLDSLREEAASSRALPTDAQILAYLKRLEGEISEAASYFTPVRWTQRPRRQEDETTAILRDSPAETRPYDDIVKAYRSVPQAVVLSAPGGGKTTALRRLAIHLADRAIRSEENPRGPVPLLASLDEWKETNEPLDQYLGRVCPDVGSAAIALSHEGRLVLLLDGLNEATRDEKAAAISEFRNKLAKDTPTWVSCRRDDYVSGLDLDLELDTLTIEELTPPRVRKALQLRMEVDGKPAAEAERLFWQLTDEALADVFATRTVSGGEEEAFWSRENAAEAERRLSWRQRELWRQHVLDEHSLVRLAANPFTLEMVYRVWNDDQLRPPGGDLPRNRADLFERFIRALLRKEKLIKYDPSDGGWLYTEEGEQLLTSLRGLAWRMQRKRIKDREVDEGDFGVLTLISRKAALRVFKSERLLKKALDTTLLEVRKETGPVGQKRVRFRHQLMQEFFTAQALKRRLKRKQASELWPTDRWWKRSGWEEVSILLAGLHSNDCRPVIRWLAEAQPEVAAQCIVESGANIPKRDDFLRGLRDRWMPRLTSVEVEPRPEARAAVGRALGRLRYGNNRPLDDRPGVALYYEEIPGLALDAKGIPDIVWVDIPGRQVGDGESGDGLEPFKIARYPITNIQFEAFLKDPQGYINDEWWKAMEDPDRNVQPGEWNYSNHPRETVSCCEAMAFCRWLSFRRSEEITLPTGEQWQRAARGPGGHNYFWGDNYEQGYANVSEVGYGAANSRLRQTSAVGAYPKALWDKSDGTVGSEEEFIADLHGNVWEWCVGWGDYPGLPQPPLMLGGSWLFDPVAAQASIHYECQPDDRDSNLGFRVVSASPIR